MVCCVCGTKDSEHFCVTRDRLHGVPGDFQYVRCRRCGVIYQNPQVVPEDVHHLYPEDYAPWDSPPGIAVLPKWKRALRDSFTITGLPSFVQQRLNRESQLLDVGCGNGKFMARIAADHPECKVEGIDFSIRAAESAKDAGFEVHVGTLPEVAARLPKYDVITMWWYLEHLHEPEEALRICARLLNPGGYLCCGVPNERSVCRLIFGGRWYHLDPPRHFWIFSPWSLSQLMDRAGLSTTYVKQDYSPWGILGSLQYLLGNKSVPGASWVDNRYLKLIFRAPALIQGLFHAGDTFAIYGQPKDPMA